MLISVINEEETQFPWYPEEVSPVVSLVLELGFLILEQFQAAVYSSWKLGAGMVQF